MALTVVERPSRRSMPAAAYSYALTATNNGPLPAAIADDRVRGARRRVRHVGADRYRLGLRAQGGLPTVRRADDHLHAQHVAGRRARVRPT